jgi:hypothetical protein
MGRRAARPAVRDATCRKRDALSEPKPPVDDLFGDEDLGLEGAPPPDEGSGRRLPLKLMGAVLALVALGLLWWLSSRHHEKFFIVVHGDTVKVERGYYFPFGSGAYTPSPAYEPFTLPPGVAPEKTGAMSANEVDRVLHRLFITIAEKEIADVEAGDPDEAELMLLRAQKLLTTGIADDRKLLELLGDVAFRRGLTEVRGVQARFDKALEQFRLAAMRGGVAYKGADRWVEAITRLRAEFRSLSVESGLDPDQILSQPPALPPIAPKKPAPEAGDEKKKAPAAADAGVPG